MKIRWGYPSSALPDGAVGRGGGVATRGKLQARTSDLSRSGCYIDTPNPIPHGSKVRPRITHHDELFGACGDVVYVSYGLGMDVAFIEVSAERLARLERWLENSNNEF